MKGEERGEGRPSQKPGERFGGGGELEEERETLKDRLLREGESEDRQERSLGKRLGTKTQGN